MALAYGTQVGTPTGYQSIETLEVGDALLASGEPLGWKTWAVKFSQGVPPDSSRSASLTMIFVRWDDGEIIASPDHVFVRADLKLVQAQMLTPGIQLLGADGGLVTVEAVLAGQWAGGIHAIGTNAPWPAAQLAGHLLSTQGVVTGDFFVEQNFERDVPNALTGLPVIGSPAYENLRPADLRAFED